LRQGVIEDDVVIDSDHGAMPMNRTKKYLSSHEDQRGQKNAQAPLQCDTKHHKDEIKATRLLLDTTPPLSL
jgi:hypothetical protein